MTRKKKGLVLVLLIAVAAMGAFLLFQTGGKERQTLNKIIPDEVDLQVRDVVYTDVGSRGVKWEVRAAKGVFVRRDGEARLEGVTARIIFDDGRSYEIRGDTGTYNTTTKDMALKGNVTIVSPGGERASTDQVYYHGKDRVLTTDSVVTLETEKSRLQGKGMILRIDTREMRLQKDISAVLKGR